MSVPGQVPLNPAQVDELIKGITTRLVHSLPASWDQLFVDFRSVGTYVEVSAQLINVFGQAHEWDAPAWLVQEFADLRQGMYREGSGTWFAVKYHLAHFAKIGVNYEWQAEPRWTQPPPPDSFRQELELFPRDPENTPAWLAERTSN
ncbi:hypothetical protein LZ318_04485 [Saccharopolyspora indica]|uniref:hypothetical protein n=1 Tax=Saccharopolyspora indica TaxID=1229659 RepID=UPI0022EB66C1|nr:hypothetical protein [Saccharopolyspora indica]MDA3646474.1 hypothetical protein [Saccharopolyspora indica]